MLISRSCAQYFEAPNKDKIHLKFMNASYPGGGFHKLLTDLGLLQGYTGGDVVTRCYYNLHFYVGLLALDKRLAGI